MKTAAFNSLPKGTVILLRPTGTGSRSPGAEHELILARIESTTPLARTRSLIQRDEPEPVPHGFTVSPVGPYRAVTITHVLNQTTEGDADDDWRTTVYNPHRGVAAREVVGAWDNLRDEVLTARRSHFAQRETQRKVRQERDAAERAVLDEALEVVRPALKAAGLSHLLAMSEHTRPGQRTFTTEEVAQIIAASKEGGQS